MIARVESSLLGSTARAFAAHTILRRLTAQCPACSTARSIEETPVIERGDRVLIIVNLSAVTVSASGTALHDGAIGSEIAVKNDGSGKRLRGVVVKRGVVRVDVAEYPRLGG